jgi:predicted negative regulator of RcsB-dependent stress response
MNIPDMLIFIVILGIGLAIGYYIWQAVNLQIEECQRIENPICKNESAISYSSNRNYCEICPCHCSEGYA